MLRTLFGCLISLLACLTAFPAWAITYVGAQAAGVAGTTSAQTITFTSLTGGSGAAPIAGDLVVVTWCQGNIGTDYALTIANASAVDYTLLGSELYSNDSYDTNMRSAYRVMPDPVETQVVLSCTTNGGTCSTANGGTYSITVFRGVHATPLEQAVQEGTNLNSILVNPGSITPTTAGTVVYVSGCGTNDAGGTYTSSDLTDFRAVNGVDNEDSVLGSGHFFWTSGAFSPATFGGITDSTQFSNAWTIAAFAPAAAGGATCTGALMLLGVGGC